MNENKQGTRIVIDSTAGMSEELTERYAITTVPLAINFPDATILDDHNLVSKDFYERLATAAKLPTTSQPSTGAFVDVFHKLVTEGANDIISVHLSGAFSGTVRAAQQAADIVTGEHTTEDKPLRVHV